MGQLKPGVEYIYTRRERIVYQREDDSLDEEAVGWEYDPRIEDGRPLIDDLRDAKLWGEIRRDAKTNPLLKEALDRAIMIYPLSKKDGKK
jgi:hypothetical protein